MKFLDSREILFHTTQSNMMLWFFKNFIKSQIFLIADISACEKSGIIKCVTRGESVAIPGLELFFTCRDKAYQKVCDKSWRCFEEIGCCSLCFMRQISSAVLHARNVVDLKVVVWKFMTQSVSFSGNRFPRGLFQIHEKKSKVQSPLRGARIVLEMS